MKRRRRLWTAVFGILISVAVSVVYAAWPGRSTFTVSPETTYVTGPLDKRGYVDYVTALNERLRGDIKPEDNANVLIWKALGPRPEGGNGMPPEYFQWLGIQEPPEQGEYLVSYTNYLKEHVKVEIHGKREDYFDRQTRAMKWPWNVKDDPELADWLKRAEKPLAVFAMASRRPAYYNPLVPPRTEEWSGGLLESLLPSVQRCRDVAAALTCRAMLRVSEGRVDEAWADLLTCHRLGRLMGRGGTLIEMLVGIAIDQIASRAEIVFLDHAILTSKQILTYLRDLQQLPPMPALADKIDLAERFVLLDTMMLVARQGMPFLEGLSGSNSRPKDTGFKSRMFTRNIDWDPAFRNARLWYDRIVAAMRIADRAAREHALAQIETDLKALKSEVAQKLAFSHLFMGPTGRGEAMGDIVIGLMLPGLNKVRQAADRCEQWQRNLHLAFALAAYQRDHGKYPATLNELAPKYLDAIPDDLFSDNPLIYGPIDRGYLLSSVGPNGSADEGRTNDDEPRGDDLAVRIPVREPKGNQ